LESPLSTNLAGLRQLAYDRVDWAPKASAEQKARTNRAINRALLRLAQDCPNAFFQGTGYFSLQADVRPTLSTDLVNVVNNDAWVLETALTVGTTGAVVWDNTGQWNGRMIQLTDSDGNVQDHRIRDIWLPDSVPQKVRISLYTPWETDNVTGLSFRVYTESYYMPDDVMQVQSVRLKLNGRSQPLEIIGQEEAEDRWMGELLRTQTAIPTIAYRRSPFALPAPTFQPIVAAAGSGSWSVSQHRGEFQYVYTYCWGLRDQQWAPPGPFSPSSVEPTSPNRYEPLWESSPSPVSDTITTTGLPITLTLPDIEAIQGFGSTSTARYGHSGWYLRIYRKRLSYNDIGLTVPIGPPESDDAYHLLDMIDFENGWSLYTDSGLRLPDYHRRLRDVNSYQAIAFHPRPAEDYTVVLRYTKRPQALEDDYDAPLVHPDAAEALIHLTVAYLYETQGNGTWYSQAMAQYELELMTLQKRYGDLRPDAVPIRKNLARVSSPRRTRRYFY
jgi:hypothetical protein